VRRIGLTGGIGSGKSTVAKMLEDLGAVVIDADQVSRELVEPGMPALAELVEAFGPRILRSDGSLNRGLLAQIAFASPQATARLNAIMHPRIARESALRIQAAEGSVVVYDMPLLVETGQRDVVDAIIVVDVPEDEQVRRAVEFRGMDPVDVRRRIQAQASRQQRRAVADYVIDNSGTLDETRAQVSRIWPSLLPSAPVTG
jgi:dephospho-CoA kinase